MKTKKYLIPLLILTLIVSMLSGCTTASTGDDAAYAVLSDAIDDENIWTLEETFAKLGYSADDFEYDDMFRVYNYTGDMTYLGYPVSFYFYHDDRTGFGPYYYEIFETDFATAVDTVSAIYTHLDNTFNRSEFRPAETYTNPAELLKEDEFVMGNGIICDSDNQRISVDLHTSPTYNGDTFESLKIMLKFNYEINYLKEKFPDLI